VRKASHYVPPSGNGKVPDFQLSHARGGLLDLGFLVCAHRSKAHVVANPGVIEVHGVGHRPDDVALGQDSPEAGSIEYGQSADLFVHHVPGGGRGGTCGPTPKMLRLATSFTFIVFS
jgi:hypothetical protein